MYFVAEIFELKQFKDRFLTDVKAEEIKAQLLHHEVISETIHTKIERAESAADRNCILFQHVSQHTDRKNAKLLFEVMKAARGSQPMNKLGEEMLACLIESEYLMCVHGI